MQMVSALPNQNYNLRYTSPNEIWEVGLQPVIFGVRVQIALVGDYGPTIDYCAGNNPVFICEVLATILTIMGDLPENISRPQLKKLFPDWKIRPIHKCECWPKLQQMASKGVKVA